MKDLAITIFVLLVSFAYFAEADTIEENEFQSQGVGLSVTKPNDWNFVSAEKNLENLKQIQLDDEEFHELMLRHSTVPLVTIAKHREPYDDLNPSLKITVRPLGGLPGDQPIQILELILPQMRSMFADFEVIQGPMELDVAGHQASYAKFHYLLETQDGNSFPTCSELWLVPRGNFFFLIGAGTRQDEKTGSRDEIQSILSSLKIEKIEN